MLSDKYMIDHLHHDIEVPPLSHAFPHPIPYPARMHILTPCNLDLHQLAYNKQTPPHPRSLGIRRKTHLPRAGNLLPRNQTAVRRSTEDVGRRGQGIELFCQDGD